MATAAPCRAGAAAAAAPAVDRADERRGGAAADKPRTGPDGLAGPARRDRRLPALQAGAVAHEPGLRRRQPRRGSGVRGRGARRRRGRAGRAVRGQGGPAADQDDRGDGLFARRRLHLQRPQVPPARQPQPGARRGGELRAVPQAPARRDPAAHDRRAREVRRPVPAARRHADHAAARRLPQLRRASR